MAKYKSDIEIARKAKMMPIKKILAKIKVPDKSSAFSPMGRHIAKINFEFLDKLNKKKDGNLVLVLRERERGVDMSQSHDHFMGSCWLHGYFMNFIIDALPPLPHVVRIRHACSGAVDRFCILICWLLLTCSLRSHSYAFPFIIGAVVRTAMRFLLS